MSKSKLISLILIVFISAILLDFKITGEKETKEYFEDFDCQVYTISLKGGTGSYCNLICQNGNKIHLPNNVDFEENFRKGDELMVVKTGFFGFVKKIVFKNFGKKNTVEVSDLDNGFIFYVLIISIFFHLFYFEFSRLQLFQVLYGLFVTLNVFLLFFYIKSH